MSLSLAEGLREARSIPTFSGTSDYALTSYLRDVSSVLSLVSDADKPTVRVVLANRLQGKALRAVETLVTPSWDQILAKLKEEFGVRESFLNLRNQAMDVVALSIEELHHKLNEILSLMNTKYYLNQEVDTTFNPSTNEKLIFEIYLNLLPLNIKTLLIQNEITTISKAYSYYIENNLIKDIYLKNRKKTYPNNNSNAYQNYPQKSQNPNLKNQFTQNTPNNQNEFWRNSPRNQCNNQNGSNQQRFNFNQNRSNQIRHNTNQNRYNPNTSNSNQTRNNNFHEPMDISNISAQENFHAPPQNPTYQ